MKHLSFIAAVTKDTTSQFGHRQTDLILGTNFFKNYHSPSEFVARTTVLCIRTTDGVKCQSQRKPMRAPLVMMFWNITNFKWSLIEGSMERQFHICLSVVWFLNFRVLIPPQKVRMTYVLKVDWSVHYKTSGPEVTVPLNEYRQRKFTAGFSTGEMCSSEDHSIKIGECTSSRGCAM